MKEGISQCEGAKQHAIEFVLKHNLIDNYGEMECSEIGDGNINYIFRIKSPSSNESIIVKHASALTRTSGNPLSKDRLRIESEILAYYNELVPGVAPRIYKYDGDNNFLAMEDLCEYENLRYALMSMIEFETLPKDISEFMAKTLIHSTDVVMHPKEKKKSVKHFTNPDLCDITERLVFTDPFDENKCIKYVTRANIDFIQSEICKDNKLKLQVAILKDRFKNNTQSLLHGDLHTGSVFVKKGKTKILDPEFAFYGPAGYDVGNILANLIFAKVRTISLKKDATKSEEFNKWISNVIIEILDLFRQKSIIELSENMTESMARVEGFIEWYVDSIIEDSIGFAGTELLRRIAGEAKVADIDTIQDVFSKVYAERLCVSVGKRLVMNRRTMKGFELMDVIEEAVLEANVQNTR